MGAIALWANEKKSVHTCSEWSQSHHKPAARERAVREITLSGLKGGGSRG